MKDNTVYLAVRDWLHEASLSLCAVLALTSILSPLLILHGVHTGVVEKMRERLMQDPSILVVMPQGSSGSGFSEETIREIKARPECAFCIGRTRSVASELSVISPTGEALTITLEPSSEEDPILERYHIGVPTDANGLYTVVLTHTAAHKLKAIEGTVLHAKIARRLSSGKYERTEFDLHVQAVLPAEAHGMDTGFLALPLLIDIQDFRDGYSTRLLPTGTERPKGLHRYFESFRAYATSLDEVEQFDIWCQKNNIPVKTRSKDIASIKNIDKSLSTIIHVISATTGTGFFAFMISTLHASIRRKWKMLGMLRLIGFSRLSILIYPMTQAITTGLFGILLSFLIYGIIAFGIDMLFASQSGGEAICVVHTVDFCIIAVIVQLLIIISSWKISLQASRIDPSLAIRES
ncbi:MAG: ABC transporter permease [Lachnospiraceae bacterium]|nr:ABC transporter permease [Lachnospiraceae bacterium]